MRAASARAPHPKVQSTRGGGGSETEARISERGVGQHTQEMAGCRPTSPQIWANIRSRIRLEHTQTIRHRRINERLWHRLTSKSQLDLSSPPSRQDQWRTRLDVQSRRVQRCVCARSTAEKARKVEHLAVSANAPMTYVFNSAE